jgi:hypothetical protein
MTNERFEQLLRDADGAADVPAVDPTLAERVRARAMRQQRVRAVGGGVFATACFIAIVGWVMRPDAQSASPAPAIVRATSPQVPAPDVHATDLRAQMLALSQDADQRAAAAEALWAAEPAASSASRRTASFAATTDVAAQVERAAFTMVYQAARMPAAPAAAVYREVSRTFPDAPSAQVARQRLTALETRKDG